MEKSDPFSRTDCPPGDLPAGRITQEVDSLHLSLLCISRPGQHVDSALWLLRADFLMSTGIYWVGRIYLGHFHMEWITYLFRDHLRRCRSCCLCGVDLVPTL